MTIAEHLLAIAEELETRVYRPRWVWEMVTGVYRAQSMDDDIAAFRRAAELAAKDHTNG